MTQSLAFYVDNLTLELLNLIKKISAFLIDDIENKTVDFLIFADTSYIVDSNISIFPTFYSRFYRGSIVFFDPDSYNQLNLTKDRFLYLDAKDSAINGNLPSFRVITPENNSFKVINYEKLQQSF